MKEILITSSVLILALLALRGIFRKSLSRRMQYALWGLVALRLLLPVNLPPAEHSVLSAVEPVRTAITEWMETPHTLLPRQDIPGAPNAATPAPGGETTPGTGGETTPGTGGADPVTTPAAPIAPGTEPAADPVAPVTPADTDNPAQAPTVIRFPAARLLTVLWLAGAAGMALWFALSNLRFARFLRRSRTALSLPDCPLPVYLVEEGLPSPCLAGLLHPAVYLTPAVAGDERRLRHVLAHELTHARQGDPLWSLLRCLCLVVYWFDPLVWIAALASRADCELACDEGALRRLGEGERIPYGETLLSLIPVGRADPMLSATTMTAGKRQLRERIQRIVSGRRPAALAVFAVLCAAAILCAATFTGSVSRKVDGTLSGAEIRYFNQEFFNQASDSPEGIRDHFLTSRYERPEDIDLFELFYCGVYETDGQRPGETVSYDFGQYDADCPTDVLPAKLLDAILRQYTGLGLGETTGKGLENFDCPEEGIYTHAHGDTNDPGEVRIFAGERQGDTVTLYYTTAARQDWHRLTLREGEDGSYQFRSNLPCEKPAVAPRLPETAPVLTLSLADARALEPQPMPLTHHGDDRAEEGGGLSIQSESGEEYSICAYRATDGRIYVALEHTDWVPTGDDGRTGYVTWESDSFLTVPENGDTQSPNAVGLDFFRDLLGRSGFVVSYSDNYTSTVQEYYYLAEDGTPCLLLRTSELGLAEQLDLDGDGVDELYNSQGLLYFLRDGTVYEADLRALLQTAWPDFDDWDQSYLDRNYRHVEVSGFARMPEWGEYLGEEGHADFNRYLYYDGESLLVYRELRNVTYTDHLASTVDVPGDVATAAKALALDLFNQAKELAAEAQPDDWRVTAVTLEDTIPLQDGRSVEIYRVSGSCHAAVPARLVRAGSVRIGEDAWFSGYGDCSPYLTFVVSGQQRALVESDLPDDCSPGSPAFSAAVTELLLEQGCAELADLSAETLSEYFCSSPFACLDRLSKTPETDWDGILNVIRSGQDTWDREDFKDAMYRLLHGIKGLTEDAGKCYRRLLYLENSDESRVPVSVTLMCESAMQHRCESDRYAPAYADAGLVSCQTRSVVRAADYPDFFGRRLEVYRVDYRYLCQYPEKVQKDGKLRAAGEWVFPSPDNATYVLFEVKEDLHRVCLGDTDIPDAAPETDPAAFRKALEDYFRTEHPGQIEGLGRDIRSTPGTPVYLWDRGSYQAAADYLASYIGDCQTSSMQVLDGGWELWNYEKDGSWYLFLVSRDGKYAQLPLPVYDGSLRYAEPATTYHSGGPVSWEARVPRRVYSAVNGNLAQESGIYRYELDLETLTLYESFTPTEGGAKDASFDARSLSAGACGKTRQELLSWLTAEEPEAWQERLPTGKYWEQPDGAVAYLAILTGVPHTDQFQLYLRFPDGTEAQLPLANTPVGFAVLTPSSAAFTHSGFTYDIDASELGFPGSVYRYTVDLTAKTVAMTVTQA